VAILVSVVGTEYEMDAVVHWKVGLMFVEACTRRGAEEASTIERRVLVNDDYTQQMEKALELALLAAERTDLGAGDKQSMNMRSLQVAEAGRHAIGTWLGQYR
jgi:hypothetical protein